MPACIAAHATIVRYDEGDLAQPQIPTETLYHRWTISMKFITHNNVVQLQAVNIDVCKVLSLVQSMKHHRPINRIHRCPRVAVAIHAIPHSPPRTSCSDTAGRVACGSTSLAWRHLVTGWIGTPKHTYHLHTMQWNSMKISLHC
jgi:hypothetical protein